MFDFFGPQFNRAYVLIGFQLWNHLIRNSIDSVKRLQSLKLGIIGTCGHFKGLQEGLKIGNSQTFAIVYLSVQYICYCGSYLERQCYDNKTDLCSLTFICYYIFLYKLRVTKVAQVITTNIISGLHITSDNEQGYSYSTIHRSDGKRSINPGQLT